jgi:hypothetical protein
VYRTTGTSSVTYHYVLRNHSEEDLHNFMVGTTLSSDSCPELQKMPVGLDMERNRCPKSIVVRKPWTGCVNGQEECRDGFLEFDYPDPHAFHGLAPGDSLAFSVRLATADSAYERASFWIVSDNHEYEGRTRVVTPPERMKVER